MQRGLPWVYLLRSPNSIVVSVSDITVFSRAYTRFGRREKSKTLCGSHYYSVGADQDFAPGCASADTITVQCGDRHYQGCFR